MNPAVIVDYTERSVAIFGAPAEWNEHFKAYHGKWNPSLTFNGAKTGGYIFSSVNKEMLTNLVNQINLGETPNTVPLPESKTNEAKELTIVSDWSGDRIAVFGNTMAHKENLKKLKGTYSPHITDPATGRQAGWLFPKALESVITMYAQTGKMPNEVLGGASSTFPSMNILSSGISQPATQMQVGQSISVMGVMYTVESAPRPWWSRMTKQFSQNQAHAAQFPQSMNAYYVPAEGGWIVDPAIMDPSVYTEGKNKIIM